MNNNISLKIVVAETSVIVRSGLAAVLKRIPNLNAHPIEVSSPEALQNYIHLHTPDIVIVNPTFGGWFDLPSFKTDHTRNSIKYIALVCSVIDNNALKEYDESIAICDDIEVITAKSTAFSIPKRKMKRQRTGNAQPTRKGNHHLRRKRNDQQGDCRQTVSVHPYRHYPPPQHCAQTANTLSRRPHHLRHCEQAGGTERY